jgi:hypothetical protein
LPILIDDLITAIEVELEAAEREAVKAHNEIKFILKRAGELGTTNLSAEDDTRVQELFLIRDKAKDKIKGIQAKLETARRAKAEELEERDAQEKVTETPAGQRARTTPTQNRAVTIGREERTYRPDTDRKGTQFLRDVARAFVFNDAEAQHRLSQHMAEERVERSSKYFERAAGDSTTANWAGLTVPQYLTDMYAPAVAALRPFADICNHHDLPPSGMTINISQVTTATANTIQSSEMGTVGGATTAIDDTLLTENVQTAAGTATLSRQAIDRGTGIEEVTLQDMFRRYATNLDSTLLNQATTGMSALAASAQRSYVTTPPTIATLYPKILGATADVEAALLAQAVPSHVVLHSRRWYWMMSQLTSTWPLIGNPQWDAQSGGQATNAGYNQGNRGVLPSGLGVCVDNNVTTALGTGTNQDEVYVVARDECHLWESPDAPAYIRAEQPKAQSLGVILVLYGYFAYTLRRYASAIGSVGGTGLVSPVF